MIQDTMRPASFRMQSQLFRLKPVTLVSLEAA
jgi:hypothetical protein